MIWKILGTDENFKTLKIVIQLHNFEFIISNLASQGRPGFVN
jgi:hypothetical protein